MMTVRYFRTITALLLTGTCFAVADEPAPESWPNWMGPNRDGISQEGGWSTAWPETGLPIIWEKQIGIGFSSVAIADGQLYTMGHVDGTEVVHCFDSRTGEEYWSYGYPCELNNNLHEGGPGSTPTVHDGRVYTVGKEGQLYCFDVNTSEVLWEKRLQEDLEVPLPEWGFSSSAVIDGDRLILEAGRVVAYDRKTGKKLWQTDKHSAGYGSAALFKGPGGKSLLATLDCDDLRVLESKTGKELAYHEWSSPFRTNSTTPIVKDDLIYISTGYQIGCGLFRFDGKSLTEVYSNRQMRNHFNNSILFDGYLYGFDGNSNLGRIVQLTCMNFETGEVAWKQRGLGCGSLMIADGKQIVLSESGKLIIAKATPEGFEELASSPFLEGRCWTVPVLFERHIYGRNAAGKLVCVRLPAEH